MNIDLQEKWKMALKSDKYIQGYEKLFYDGRHCCLNVLKDVAGLKYKSSSKRLHLNACERRKLKISSCQEDKFIYLNDVAKLTFQEIANEISSILFSD